MKTYEQMFHAAVEDRTNLTKENEALKTQLKGRTYYHSDAEVEKELEALKVEVERFKTQYSLEEIKRLRESNKAMEKMLCRVGKVAGVRNGDAEGLVAWLEAQKEDNIKKERATLEGVDFAIKIIVGNVVCDKPTVKAICQGIKSHFNLNHKEG